MAVPPAKPTFADLANTRGAGKMPVLNSWKGIAAYLQCGVRTAQRWERDLGLPVYRPRPGQRGPVCAFPAELQIWLRHSKLDGENAPGDVGHGHANSPLKASRELTRQSSQLVQQAAANSRLQQQRAARLLSTVQELRARILQRSRVAKDS